MSLAWQIAGVLALAAFLAVYFQLVRPLRQFKEAIHRLAGGDFRPLLLEPRRGLFRGVAGDVQKISELLKQLDQQIADEGFSLRAILSGMVEGVLIIDRSQHIRLVNDPLLRLFELSQSPVNRTVLEVFRSHELHQAIERTLTDGKPRQIELALPMPARDGYATKHFEVHAGGLNPRPKARPPGAVIVFHDVSAVKSLEAVRREFVANVSHEFRTPLAIINGYVETLLDGALDDRAMAERSLNVMQKNGHRLELLIEDLLTISRMEHRSMSWDFQPVKLREVFDRVIERLEPAIRERAARVVVEWDPAAAAPVVADPRGMEQVFGNLLENALRHGRSEGAEVRVTALVREASIVVAFADNGPGIPEGDRPHIFERFYRVKKDRSRAGGGTGLGLSIVKHAVLAHGGAVSLECPAGGGACFQVVLPLRRAGVAPEAAHAS